MMTLTSPAKANGLLEAAPSWGKGRKSLTPHHSAWQAVL